VYRSSAGTPFVEVARLLGSATRWNDLSVVADVAYQYQVRTFSNLEGMSALSDIDLGFALPPPPMVAATDGTGAEVRLTWVKPSTWSPSGYKVWRKRSGRDPWPSEPIASDLPASTLTFTDANAEPGAVYVYAVAGKSAQFNSYSDRGTPNTGYPTVLPPNGVIATDGTMVASVQLTWTPVGTTSNVSWEVWRRRAGTNDGYVRIRTVTQPILFDSTAVPGTIYQYFVKTKASNGAVSLPSITDNGYR